MFTLSQTILPASASDLASAIELMLRDFIEQSANLVSVEAPNYPAIANFTVNLSGARIAKIPPRPPSLTGEEKSAYEVDNLRLEGRNLNVMGAATDLAMAASKVKLHEGRDASGNVVLVLKNASSGELRFGMAKAALEKLIETFGKNEAAKNGVTLESVKIDWNSRGGRGVDAVVTVKARKFFMSATVNLSGSLDVNEDLLARLSALRCSGDGALASIACGALKPHLEKVNGREFSLRALPIGDLTVRELEIVASDRLEIRATFGNAA